MDIVQTAKKEMDMHGYVLESTAQALIAEVERLREIRFPVTHSRPQSAFLHLDINSMKPYEKK